jgi:hypothetical protein
VRHVLDGTVGEFRLDAQLVGLAGANGVLGGQDAQLGAGFGQGIEDGAGGDPAAQDFVITAADLHAFAAAVRNLSGRLA